MALLCVSLLGVLVHSQDVQAEEPEVVRVGVYDLAGFQERQPDGSYMGYNMDCLQVISMDTGWQYEYVNVGSLEQGIAMLEEKKIDLIGPCMKIYDYVDRFAFSQYSVGQEYTVLMTDADNNELYYEDFEHFNGIKVAVIDGYPLTEDFSRYMLENGFYAQPVYYNSVWEAVSALEIGDVDATICTEMFAGENHKIIARFQPSEYYYMTWKGNDSLIGKLNHAMRNIEYNYPHLLDGLYEQYFDQTMSQHYTREEEALIASLGVLRVGYVPGRIPLSYTDKKGELAGISRAVFDKVQEVSGLQFEYVELPYESVTLDYLYENNIDVVTGVEYNGTNASVKGMHLSTSYIDGMKVMVGRSDLVFDTSASLRIAVASGSMTLRQSIKEAYPNFYIVNYKTVDECFRALRKGDVDVLLQNQYVAEYHLSNPQNDEMKIIPIEGLNDALSFATIYSVDGERGREQHESAIIIGIINKALSQISGEQLNRLIVRAGTAEQYQYTIKDFLYRHRLLVAMLVVILAGVFGILIYIINVRLKAREKDQKTEEKIRLQQRRYKLLLDNMDDMIYEISVSGESSFSSERIRDKFGWDIPKRVEDISCHSLVEILHVHPEDEPQFRQAVERMVESDESEEVLIRLLTSNGLFLWCQLLMHPLKSKGEIISILGKIEDVDSETRLHEDLTIQSRTDRLTGLLLKQVFEQEVSEYLKNNSAKDTCFIFVDMDHFKDVNDKLGHGMGDRAIVECARKLQLIFANCDMITRFGGDEYCIFVSGIPKDTLLNKIAWCQSKLMGVYTDGNEQVSITASIGGAFCTKDTVDYRTMFLTADEAMYEVKERGRNGFVIKDI